MLTMNDITLNVTDGPNPEGMLIAFAIDNEIVHIMSTYKSFYNLITSGCEIVENPEAQEGKIELLFKSEEETIETLECSELLSALLRSFPLILIIIEEPRPSSIEELGLARYVDIGWGVDDANNFIPPLGWVHPASRPTLTEEQKVKLREMGHNVE